MHKLAKEDMKSSINIPRIIVQNKVVDSVNLNENWKESLHLNTYEKNSTFLGFSYSSFSLDENVELRTFANFKASIGKRNDEWYYCIIPLEGRITKRDSHIIESILYELPDLIEIDTCDLLKDQKLSRELISSIIRNHIPNTISLDKNNVADIISRYSVGYGILEVLLREDKLIEDIIISSPSATNEICLATRLSDGSSRSIFCKTNVSINEDQLKSFITKARIFYGGELSATKPILELEIPFLNARMTAVDRPASPKGLCVSFRRRTEQCWTLARFVALNSINWCVAGFLSLCCIARAGIVIAGGRGSGKTTLLSSLLPELPSIGRILVMEDIEELPTLQLQKEGMIIQNLSLAGGNEKASAVMRAALRMSDGPIVIGEIRGDEARILFESIRTGTANSCVLGTIHASEPEIVRDRIVFDMGLDDRSFEAIDLIVMIRQKKDTLAGTYERYVSEVVLVDSKSRENKIRYLFKTDENGHCITCYPEFRDLSSIGLKFKTHHNIESNDVLKAARILGFIRKIQAQKWLETKEDTYLSIKAIRAINDIPIDFEKFPDFSQIRNLIIEKLREVMN